MIEVIPAIDLIDGKCVRLSQGDYARSTTYHDDPLYMAKWLEDAGLKRLHLVDLDGARAGKVSNWKVLEAIAAGSSLSIDFSGGIRSQETCASVLGAGASFIGLGSIAVKDPASVLKWMAELGTGVFLLGADVKGKEVVVNGWLEKSAVSLDDFIRTYYEAGLRNFFCTDVAKDGMMAGPSVALYKEVIASFPEIRLIASGGVSSLADLQALEEAGCAGAIVGKALYEGTIKPEQLC